MATTKVNVSKISDFPKVTPAGTDQILVEKDGQGGSITLSQIPVSTPVSTRIAGEVNTLNSRIDNIVASSGDDISEIVDARQGSDGTNYASLRARLDAENNQLKGDLTSITNCKRITNWKSGYIATNESVVDINTISPHEKFRCCVLDCEKGDKFTVTLSGASVARMYCFVDANNAVIEVSPHTSDLSNHIIIAPENSSKLVLNDKSNSDSYIGVFIEHEISEIKNNVDLFTNPFSEVLYDGNPVVYHDTFAYPVNNVVTGRSNEKYDMFKFSMKRGVIAVNAVMQGSVSALCYITDSENNIIKTIERGRETEKTYIDFKIGFDNATYVYVTVNKYLKPDYSIKLLAYTNSYIENAINNFVSWCGKKIVFFGDSRTWYDDKIYGNNTKEEWKGKICKGYQKRVIEQLGIVAENKGVSGESLLEICNRIKQYNFSDVDALYISGGVNEFIHSDTTVLGSIAPIGSAFDISTTYGAMQSAIEYVLTNYPAVKILIDTPFMAWNYGDVDFPEEIAMLKKNIADLYSIPCLDLYHFSGINKVNRDYFYCDSIDIESSARRLHLNDYGNALIGDKIAGYIRAN